MTEHVNPPHFEEKIVLTALSAQRLDVFLAQSTSFSRVYCQQLIKRLCVFKLPDSIAITDCSYKVAAGDQFSFTPLPKEEFHVQAENIPLNIIHEDQHIIVINKPASMVTHPAPGHHTQTLVHALLYHCKGSLSGINGSLKPGIIHRLDRYTSGLIVIAKNDVAHLNLAHQMEQRLIKRHYIAFCHGEFVPRTLQATQAIGRHKTQRLKMAICPKGRSAHTTFVVLGTYQIPSIGKVSALRCSLHTGRTHQIRVHASYNRTPLINDTLYGGHDISEKIPLFIKGRQALHAYQLSFTHPSSNKEMCFTAPIPEDMHELFNACLSSNILFTNPELSVQKIFQT